MRDVDLDLNRSDRIAICHNPVFIIGSPRSGTTILARSLAQHSGLWSSFESEVIFSLYGSGRADAAYDHTMRRPWKSWLQDQQVDRSEFLRSLGCGINALFTSRSQGKRWVDHTLIYTLMADEIAEMFPGAFFIHMLRDGRRVVNSMINLRRSPGFAGVEPNPEYVGAWTDDFAEACKTWRRYVDSANDFYKSHPARCLTVVNEELSADPKIGFAEIFKFLCLPIEEAPGEFFGSNRINSSFKRDGPTVTNGPADPWHGWSEEQKGIFSRVAGATLIASGFATREELGISPIDPQGRESPTVVASPDTDQERDQAIGALERWAHQLEATALEQQRVISAYERWLGPLLVARRLVKRRWL